jgi:branched-chain amino acid transport system substrate-binding protein
MRRHARLTRRQFIAHTGKVGLSASLLPVSAEAAAAPNEIKLGAVYPLSGNFANVAVEFRNAAVMALDFINSINDVTGEVPFASDLPLAQGRGIPSLNGPKLRLIFADSQGKPELALSDADRLITADKCVGLFGCDTSATTITASQVAERYGIPFINPDSSSPRLTRRGFRWFVRIQPDDATFSKDFFVFLKELKEKRPDVKATRLALLHENTAFWDGRHEGAAGVR